MAKKKGSFPPIPTDSMSEDDRDDLIDSGWRVFVLGEEEFIVPSRPAPPPTIGGRRAVDVPAKPMPRPTYSYETHGPRKGQRMDLLAWPYGTTTISELDNLMTVAGKPVSRRVRREMGTPEAPRSIAGMPGLFGYIWTDHGLHVYQHGKHKPIKGSDEAYERISRDNRGWYGDRIRSKDESKARTLITNDVKAAEAWLLAGGKVRLVKDVARSYAVSRQGKGFK